MSIPWYAQNASMQMERLQCGLAEALPVSEIAKTKKDEVAMDIRSLQKPLKDQYRNDPNASHITIQAKGGQTDVPVACSVDIGRAIYQAEAHKGVGGAGAGACSGDLLLGALAACAQITCQMVAAAMAYPPSALRSRWKGTWIFEAPLAYQKTCLSALRPFDFILMSLRRRRPQNNCADCGRKQNSIAW